MSVTKAYEEVIDFITVGSSPATVGSSPATAGFRSSEAARARVAELLARE